MDRLDELRALNVDADEGHLTREGPGCHASHVPHSVPNILRSVRHQPAHCVDELKLIGKQLVSWDAVDAVDGSDGNTHEIRLAHLDRPIRSEDDDEVLADRHRHRMARMVRPCDLARMGSGLPACHAGSPGASNKRVVGQIEVDDPRPACSATCAADQREAGVRVPEHEDIVDSTHRKPREFCLTCDWMLADLLGPL
ncbi:MAG: hypothetical protein H0U86_01135 [Chloroflexi bacterium]|nr:hypothetical protein [Chloroflexota bacterium]